MHSHKMLLIKMNTLAKKKLNRSGEYPFTGLQHSVLRELKREIPLELPVSIQKNTSRWLVLTTELTDFGKSNHLGDFVVRVYERICR